jgi:hypothetical protein
LVPQEQISKEVEEKCTKNNNSLVYGKTDNELLKSVFDPSSLKQIIGLSFLWLLLILRCSFVWCIFCLGSQSTTITDINSQVQQQTSEQQQIQQLVDALRAKY